MRLKVRENLLFFAPEGEDEHIFALSLPLDETVEKADEWKNKPSLLQSHFIRELAKERWGRIAIFKNKSFCDVALLNSRGGGWVRSLFSDHFQRVGSANFIQDVSSLLHSDEQSIRSVLLVKWKRPFKENSKQPLSLQARKRAFISPCWVRGSLMELRNALEAALSIFPPNEPPYYDSCPFVFTRSAFNPARLDWRRIEPSPELEQLGQLLLELNVCVGQNVNANGSFFEPYFAVGTRADSMHERIEAMLRLRDMVRGTCIEPEVLTILRRVRC